MAARYEQQSQQWGANPWGQSTEAMRQNQNVYAETDAVWLAQEELKQQILYHKMREEMMRANPSIFIQAPISEDPACNPVAQSKGNSGMNYSTAIFLINKHARAISTTYEIDVVPNRPAPRVTFKTLDPEIKVGDLVLVPTHTRHNMTVVKVVEVDVDVDFDGGPQLAWIVGRVDATGYQKTLEQEAVAIAAIRSAETRKKRDALRDAILADQMEAIKALPIAAMNGETRG